MKLSNSGAVGLVGVALLLVCYVRLFAFRFLSPNWSIAILILSAVAVAAFIGAGSRSSRWWYLGTLLSVLSAFLVLAFNWG